MDMIRGCSVLLYIAFLTTTIVSASKERTISVEQWECPQNYSCHNQSIVHVLAKATDNSSTIHYVWTTYPVPTMIVSYTTLNVSLEIDWANLTANNTGIMFEPAVNYTFGFALSRIYEFEDSHDKADISSHGKIVVHNLAEGMAWDMKIDNSSNKVTFSANDETVIINCIASDSQGRESSLPHDLHTADSSRFSLTLANTTLSTNKTRFAFELMYIVHKGDKPSVSTEKSIDDEYTPAVFETVYGKVGQTKHKAYSQWKPIAYTDADLGRKYQTKASAGGIIKLDNRSWNIAEHLSENYETYGLNVTFGLSKDGFYQKNKYLVWSGIVGYGDPATSSLSFLVILIISIGLGLPLAIIIFGGTYVQIRKRCCKPKVSTTYSRIN